MPETCLPESVIRALKPGTSLKLPSLHAFQRDALVAFAVLGGLFLAMSAGSGKSLVGAVCASTGDRTVVVVPAALRTTTATMYAGYGVTRCTFISYNQISLDADLLEQLQPDVLILEESHKLKRVGESAWGRRVARYLSAHPTCRVVISTGSIMQREVTDYAHMMVWALRAGSPVPRSQAAWPRLAQDIARDPAAWLATLKNTPGVFLDAGALWQGRLLITEDWREPLCPDALERAQAGLAPDGWAVEGWAQDELEKQLACGFYLRREPRPSPALLDAQRSWNKCVEQAKAYGLADTEKLTRAVYPTGWAQWQRALEAEPGATQVAEWLTDPYVPSVEPGTIVFVHHVELGQHLAQLTGWPYHRQGALDASGVKLDETDAPIALASLSACSEGLNPQRNFSKLVYLEPPSDPRVWQQSLARVCRQGQLADAVTCEIVIQAPIYGRALDSARKAAHKIERESGQQQWLIQAEKQ